jgi:hypothetical protein
LCEAAAATFCGVGDSGIGEADVWRCRARKGVDILGVIGGQTRGGGSVVFVGGIQPENGSGKSESSKKSC